MNISIIDKDCCGCRSCEQSCPKKCISMKENDEGFIYPKIDNDSCINCGICLKKCPIHNYKYVEKESSVFALVNKNKEELMNSASGGASYLAMKAIIERLNGVCYGVAYDSNFVARTIRVESLSNLNKLQSSKYVFADTNNTFSQIEDDLKKGIFVLFSGTSCQVDGLLNYLGSDYKNLFTISLICHGTPSPKLFSKYLEYEETRNKSKIKEYNHRFKLKNKSGYFEHFVFENNKTITRSFTMSPYGADFLACNASRESCYNCRYCNTSRVGDWSIGDFWGIEEKHKDFDYKKGHSLVIVNGDKGKRLFELIIDSVNYVESTMDNAKYGQEHLKAPAKRPKIRDTYYEKLNFEPDFFKHRTPKKSLRYYLKKLCPKWLKKIIKKMLCR